MGKIRKINANRIVSLVEKQAYKNLKDYDGGIYKINSLDKIINILSKDQTEFKYTSRRLDISQDEINEYIRHAQIINAKHADFNPGIFIERNSYEASFAKKVYYSSELEFIINLFISHHNIHAFDDGNKRTALNLFVDFISMFTNLCIEDILVIQDAQILYLEKKIDKDEFKKIIYSEVKNKMFKNTIKCNLEHLIPRSDVEETQNDMVNTRSDRRSSFNLTELEKGQFFYEQLRKPIFQRDTNQWTVARLEKLILTFLEDGLIPAIILWEDFDGAVYVIDGAHRISSLIAWVNSDYGEENELNDSNHAAIQEYINKKIGSYAEIKNSKDEKYKHYKQVIAKRSVAVQWVTGNYEKVKESFIRINEQGVVITVDEKELIENDKLPVSKLSRAILSHGLGQVSKNQNEKTQEIFERFFKPFLSHQLNVYPLAGSLHEDFVISKIYTAIKIIDKGENLSLESLESKVLDILSIIQDKLSICQKIYFYGATKHFKTNSFYGFICFILALDKDKALYEIYKKNRKKFEDYLVNNERHVQTIARIKRQAKRAYEEVSLYYKEVLLACQDDDFSALQAKFKYLDFSENNHLSAREQAIRINYEKFISETPRCIVCGGFIDGDVKVKRAHNCCS